LERDVLNFSRMRADSMYFTEAPRQPHGDADTGGDRGGSTYA
jgi:hypothetical protein